MALGLSRHRAWVVEQSSCQGHGGGFFFAVGSQANTGVAASAPVVAAAFHSTLASVGVLLPVIGFAVGTDGPFICGYMLKYVPMA
jgi:hypothetical protein